MVASACVSILAAYAYVNAITPVSTDMWRHVAAGRAHDGFLPGVFRRYIGSYNGLNPRLGEIVTMLSGRSDLVRIATQVGSLIFLLATAVYIATGPTAGRNLIYRYSVGAIVVIAAILAATPTPGQMLFYPPRTANYLFGYGLLLAFLVPYRRALSGWRPEGMTGLLMFPLGFAAGMSNEHTVPVHLLCLGTLLVFLAIKYRWSSRDAWKFVGLAGLFLGYLCLFFAPGESHRRGGSKLDAMTLDPGVILDRWADLFGRFGRAAGPLIVVLAVTAVALSLLSARDGRRITWRILPVDMTLVCLYLGATTIGMVAILAVSPYTPDRLLFASTVNLAIITAILAFGCIKQIPWTEVAIVAISILISTVFFGRSIIVYNDYYQQFTDRAHMVKAQKRAGSSDIVFSPYKLDETADTYIRRDLLGEYPQRIINRAAARFYGVKSVRVLEQTRRTVKNGNDTKINRRKQYGAE